MSAKAKKSTRIFRSLLLTPLTIRAAHQQVILTTFPPPCAVSSISAPPSGSRLYLDHHRLPTSKSMQAIVQEQTIGAHRHLIRSEDGDPILCSLSSSISEFMAIIRVIRGGFLVLDYTRRNSAHRIGPSTCSVLRRVTFKVRHRCYDHAVITFCCPGKFTT